MVSGAQGETFPLQAEDGISYRAFVIGDKSNCSLFLVGNSNRVNRGTDGGVNNESWYILWHNFEKIQECLAANEIFLFECTLFNKL